MASLLERQSSQSALPTDPVYYTWSVQGKLRAIDLSLMILALISVIARVYIRIFVLRVFGIDDYFIVAAMACSVVACCIFLHVVDLGVGRHIFAIPQENMIPLLKWIFIVAILIPLAVCFVKLSIAFFLLRLTKRTPHRGFLWGFNVFLVIFTLSTFFSLVFGCIPIAASWDFSLRPPPMGNGNARCFSLKTYRNLALFSSITYIVTDVILALIPIPLIWTLKVNKRTKASLSFILSLGLFACAAAIIKAPLQWHFFDDIDSTGNHSMYYAWQMIEMNVGIIAATLPALKPAFSWILETAKAITTGASAHRTGGSRGYERQISSGYLPNTKGGKPYIVSTNTSDLESNGGSKGMDTLEMELKNLTPYHVSIAGDTRSVDESGRASNSSTDAILRIEDADGATARRILRTTKVTVVTSSERTSL